MLRYMWTAPWKNHINISSKLNDEQSNGVPLIMYNMCLIWFGHLEISHQSIFKIHFHKNNLHCNGWRKQKVTNRQACYMNLNLISTSDKVLDSKSL